MSAVCMTTQLSLFTVFLICDKDVPRTLLGAGEGSREDSGPSEAVQDGWGSRVGRG